MRKCAWEFDGTTIEDNCVDTFCNSTINQTLEVLPEKVIQKININKCINSECSETIAAAVKICFLFDGTISLPEGEDNNFLYLKSVSTSNDNFSLNKIHKTGYVE